MERVPAVIVKRWGWRRMVVAGVVWVGLSQVIQAVRDSGDAYGRSPLYSTEWDWEWASHWGMDVRGAEDFAIVAANGSEWHGFNVLRMSGDGRCVYTYKKREVVVGATTTVTESWRRAEFRVDGATVTALRELLAETGYVGLAAAYRVSWVRDGRQTFVRVRASGREKEVYCDNHFPYAVQAVMRFVEERVVAEHRVEIEAAPEGERDSGGL